MQPEQPKQQAQPVPRPQPSPAPAPQPAARQAPAAGGSSRLAKVAFGVVIVAALGFGAVATGLVHVPGFDSGTSAPQATSMTQVNPQAVDEGDHTLAWRFGTLTPDIAKARQLTTSR